MPTDADRLVRPLRPEELETFLTVDSLAFLSTSELDDEQRQFARELLELDRAVVAEADHPSEGSDGLAGIASIASFDMRVPGAWLPVAGVTWVGVHPTYRRRGVLSAMMRHQLHDLHEREAEPVAALWASEPMIYGRFGYGEATRFLTLTVPRTATLLRTPAPDESLRLRMVDPGELDLVRAVYDSQAGLRPGMPRLDERGHRLRVADPKADRDGFSALRCVVAEDRTGVRGFARFRVKQDWDADIPQGMVRVIELYAADTRARHALWRMLLDVDLAVKVEVSRIPVDDPLLRWLPNPRLARPTQRDGLHARVVDVPRALSARRYHTGMLGSPDAGVDGSAGRAEIDAQHNHAQNSSEIDLVFEVSDALCPWNHGRWRLTGDASGAECRATRDEPDLAMDVRELGAIYFGGVSLGELAGAGLVQEGCRGALARADAAFRHHPAPFSPFVF